MEEKTASAGTKRRRYETTLGPRTAGALSRRITRLSKTLKASNPTHLIIDSLPASFPNITTTGTLQPLGTNIIQGDDSNQRFGSHVDMSRVKIYGMLQPGGSSVSQTTVRITIFRSAAGVGFNANMNGTFNPVADNTYTQVLYDRFYSVCATSATAGYPTPVNISLKLKHRQKYNAAGVGTLSGEVINVQMQSGTVAGALAPIWAYGCMELYFKP